MGLDATWHIHFMDGNATDWSGMLQVILNSDFFQDSGEAIGIVLDGDTSPAAAADKARGYFSAAGLPVPQDHCDLAMGTIRTSFFIAPDGRANGAIEELLLAATDPGRRTLAEEYITLITSQYAAPKKPIKAVVQAYLAGQKDHVKSIPVAVQKKDAFDPEHAAFSAFRDFLRALS